jgi:hypothetical protein
VQGDRLHDLGNTGTTGLPTEERDQRSHDEAAERRDQCEVPARELAGRADRVRRVREQPRIDHVSDAVRPPEERALEEPDQDAEDDGAGGAREPQRDRPPDHPEVTLGATLSRFQAGRGDDGSPVAFGRECTCPGRARGWPRSYCATARVRIPSPS